MTNILQHSMLADDRRIEVRASGATVYADIRDDRRHYTYVDRATGQAAEEIIDKKDTDANRTFHDRIDVTILLPALERQKNVASLSRYDLLLLSERAHPTADRGPRSSIAVEGHIDGVTYGVSVDDETNSLTLWVGAEPIKGYTISEAYHELRGRYRDDQKKQADQ